MALWRKMGRRGRGGSRDLRIRHSEHAAIFTGVLPAGGAVERPGIPGCVRLHIRAFLKASPRHPLCPLLIGTGSGDRYPCSRLATREGQVTPSADSSRGRRCGNQFWRCCSHDCPAGGPSRTVTVRMSGKDRIEIFPSRM